MKKLVIAFLFLLPLLAHADMIGLGVRAGVAISDFSGEVPNSRDFQRDPAVGPSIGVFYDYSFFPILSLRPELSYIQKKIKVTKFFSSEGEGDLSGHYLEFTLPIVLNIPLGLFDLPVFAGGFAGVNLDDENMDKPKTFQAGFVGGAGLELNLAITDIGVEFRYERALTDFSDADVYDKTVWQTFIVSLYGKI